MGYLRDQPLKYPYNITSLNVGIRRDAPSPLQAPELRTVRRIKDKMETILKSSHIYTSIWTLLLSSIEESGTEAGLDNQIPSNFHRTPSIPSK